MEAAGETCKLCLKYIQGANLAVLDETLLGKLEFLQMDLDQSVEESNSVCKECEEKIENAFDFKSCLVNTESCLVPYVSEDKTQKVNLRVIVEKDSPSTSAGESSVEKEVCRLCKNFIDATSVISLPKILKDDSMMEVFQGHIPEMDLEVTENPMVCDSCQKSLASFSTLIASWSIANGWNDDEDMKEDFDDFEMIQVKKENVDDLSDSNTNSSTGIVDISDSVKKTTSKAKSKNGKDVKVKKEIEELSDSSEGVSVTNKDVKKEEEEDEEEGDAEMGDLQLKNEEVDIKDEDGKTFTEPTKNRLQKGFPEKKNHIDSASIQCLKCAYLIKFRTMLKNHALDRRNATTDDTRPYKCNKCPYQAKTLHNLFVHSVRYNKCEGNIDKIDILECDTCFYQTTCRFHYHSHRKTHDELYKCDKCKFSTKYRANFDKHDITHSTKVKIYKCNKCLFQSKHCYNLTKHAVIHQDVKLFKCDECDFETKHKGSLKKHKVSHNSWKKCDQCTYQTINFRNYKSHIMDHVLMTKFEEKFKKHLERQKNS